MLHRICSSLTGAISPVAPIRSYTQTGMMLADDSVVDVDVIVMATGFRNNFDFVDVPCIKGGYQTAPYYTPGVWVGIIVYFGWLTHCPLRGAAVISILWFPNSYQGKYPQHFLWNCCQVNVTWPHGWLVNIGSGKGFVPSGNEPLSEPMLTNISLNLDAPSSLFKK